MRSETRRLLETKLPPFAASRFHRYARRSPWGAHNFDTNSVFVHIPRTAGGTISEAFYGGHDTGHAILAEFWSHDRVRLENSFVFTFVRNPWDRLVSAYHRVINNPSNPRTRQWGERHLKNIQSFEKFVHRLQQPIFRHTVWSHSHFRPQAEYLNTPTRVAVDFVGRFETLQQDVAALGKQLKQIQPLGHANKTSRNDYKTYYDDTTAKIVEELYASDVEMFGYKY